MAKGPRIFHFVEGDLLPWLEAEWENEDITGFTIQLHVRQPNGIRFTRDAVIDDANVGAPVGGSAFFHFEWQAGDLVAGDSKAEVEVFDVGNLNETFPKMILRVAKEIA